MDPKDKTRILVTRRLTEKQVAYANTLGMDPVAGPAYHVEYLSDRRKVVQRLDTYSGGNWIFTSRNGVEALKRLFDSEQLARPLPKTYAVGEKTAGALSRLGLEARFPETQNAAGLARLIADDLSP
ncbi:MAG: uroporphyrinogen-III synthase, partial [Balneolaceae bacterium]